MPKEVIYGERFPGEENVPVVPLSWGVGMPVQIGCVLRENSHDPADGLYCTLGREQINRMIRALRKARDQAYGRDE